MAKIQLKQNWAGFVPGTIKTVSDSRAKYLVEKEIARYVKKDRTAKSAKQPEPETATELEAVRTKLKALETKTKNLTAENRALKRELKAANAAGASKAKKG